MRASFLQARPLLLLFLGLSLLGLAPGCDKPPATTPEEAAGPVILRVNGREITREELARASQWAQHLTTPDSSERNLQRVALTHMLLPRTALAAQDPAARQVALERATEVRATLQDGMPGPKPPAPSEVEIVRSGDAETFGPFVLGAALELEPGQWSDPVEGLGLFHLVRLIEEPVEGSAPLITLGVIDFPYRDLLQPPDELLAESTLEIVDPVFRGILPAVIRHRMKPAPSPTPQ